MRRVAQQRHQRWQALDVLAVDLDQLQPAFADAATVDLGVRRLDQRRLAHAARPPQQRVVGGKAAREAHRVVEQEVAHAVDAVQQRDVDPVDLGDRLERAAVGAPDEGVGGGHRHRRGGRRRGEPLERVGDAG